MNKRSCRGQEGCVSRKSLLLFWSGCFLFFFMLMYCAPYTYDDYEFASLKFTGIDAFLQYCLTYGNGRLLGNISGVLSNQFPVIGAVYKALVISTTVILIPEILGIRSKFSLALSFLLVTAIDPTLFSQVYTWTSGFANYVPAIFLMLSALWLIQNCPGKTGFSIKKGLLCVLLLLLGAASQLFIEHSSIVNLVFAVIILIKAFLEPDRPRLVPALFLLAGTAAGLLVMFWIPGHFMSVANNHTTGYRSLHLDSFSALIFNCARNALRLTNHYLGACGLPLCAGSAVTVHLTRYRRSEKANQSLYLMSLFPGIYLLVCTMLDTEGWYGEAAVLHHVIAMAAVLSSLCAWLIALIRMEDNRFRHRLLILLGFAIFSLLPLLVVTPIHIRVVYHSQMFVVLACVLCLNKWRESWTASTACTVTRILIAGCLALVLALVPVFLSIRTMSQARHTYIVNQIDQGAQGVESFRIPYKYVHEATDSAIGDYYYRETRKDVPFHIIPYDQWMNDHLNSVQ